MTDECKNGRHPISLKDKSMKGLYQSNIDPSGPHRALLVGENSPNPQSLLWPYVCSLPKHDQIRMPNFHLQASHICHLAI